MVRILSCVDSDRNARCTPTVCSAAIAPTMLRAATISHFRRRLVLGIALAIVAGQSIDIVLQREHFPFSHYPMYAHETRETTSLLRLYGTVADGASTKVIPIIDTNSHPFIPELNEIRMKNILAFVYGNGKPKNVEATRRVLRDFVSLYEKRRKAIACDAPELLAAECDRLTWPLTSTGMPDPIPQVETLVTSARAVTRP